MNRLLKEYDRLSGITERFSCKMCVLRVGDKSCKCLLGIEAEEEKGIGIGEVEGTQIPRKWRRAKREQERDGCQRSSG